MNRGNPDISEERAGYAAGLRKASEAKIAAAQARMKERILATGKHGEGKLTIAAVLREAGLNRLYLEGRDRKLAKQAVKDWLDWAGRGFSSNGEAAAPSRKPEDRFDLLKVDFVKLQNAYVAAQMVHHDRTEELNDAKRRIGVLEKEIAALRRSR